MLHTSADTIAQNDIFATGRRNKDCVGEPESQYMGRDENIIIVLSTSTLHLHVQFTNCSLIEPTIGYKVHPDKAHNRR